MPRYRVDHISQTFVKRFEEANPDVRLSLSERESLTSIFTDCIIETWDRCKELFEYNKPKR